MNQYSFDSCSRRRQGGRGQYPVAAVEGTRHRVEVTYTATAALASVQRYHPDVCIIDIGLPEMDANELAKHIQSLTELSTPTLIAHMA
jgi:CheY-like chemotaxis protein